MSGRKAVFVMEAERMGFAGEFADINCYFDGIEA